MAGAPSACTRALDVKLRTTPHMGMTPRVREVCIIVMDGVVCGSNLEALSRRCLKRALLPQPPAHPLGEKKLKLGGSLGAIFSTWTRHVIYSFRNVTAAQYTV